MSEHGSTEQGYAKVSVANLITRVAFPNQERPYELAVLHPTDSDKPRQALSAGLKFPEATRKYLVKHFNADPDGFVKDDARCQIPDWLVSGFLSWLKDDFWMGQPCRYVVVDPRPELYERLTKPYWQGVEPPLQESDLRHLQLMYIDSVRQPPPESGEEPGGRGASVRFFHRWLLDVTDQGVAVKLLRCRATLLLQPGDLLCTNGGRRVGQLGNIWLANNLGVLNYQP